MKSQAILVLVTAPSRAKSEKLAKLLVGRKLAACVTRLPGADSLYWWKGKIERAKEELLLIKSQKSKWPALSKAVRENHPYEICEILALPIKMGNPAYLKWINDSLR